MSSAKNDGKVRGNRFSPWNLFLLVPLVILIPPLFNHVEPRLFGVPFFYWSQVAFVFVAALSTGVVYWTTKGKPTNVGPDRLSVDDLDEGDLR